MRPSSVVHAPSDVASPQAGCKYPSSSCCPSITSSGPPSRRQTFAAVSSSPTRKGERDRIMPCHSHNQLERERDHI